MWCSRCLIPSLSYVCEKLGIIVICTIVCNHSLLQAPLAVATAGSSFSQGFLLFGFSACVPCPSNTVFGISLIPGMGCPLVISSTIWAKDVGYGAGGSVEFAGAGNTPLGASYEGSLKSSGCTPFVCGGGRPRASRYALYASKSTVMPNFLQGISTTVEKHSDVYTPSIVEATRSQG